MTNWFDLLKANKKKLRRRKKKKNLQPSQQAMVEWKNEDWGYISPKSKKKGRYAPKAVRDSLTPSEKAYENRKKRAGTKQGKQHVPRGKSARKKYKRVEGL